MEGVLPKEQIRRREGHCAQSLDEDANLEDEVLVCCLSEIDLERR